MSKSKRQKVVRGNEVFTDYDPFIGRGRGLVHISNMDFCLSIDGTTKGPNGLRAIMQRMRDVEAGKPIVYKPANIEICFYPAFAKKILEQLDDVIEAKS